MGRVLYAAWQQHQLDRHNCGHDRNESTISCADLNEYFTTQVQAVRGVLPVAAAPIGQVPLCRQTQVADLQAFLGQGLQECRGGSVYVSGVPGTGWSQLCDSLCVRALSNAVST